MSESVLQTVQAPAGPVRRGTKPATPTPPPPCRRFTLLDAMLLTAATAVGLSLSRFLEPGLDAIELVRNLRHLAGFLSPVLASWVLAWFVIRFRGPRPRFRRLTRQPGMVGCLVAATVLAIRWGHEPIIALISGRNHVFLLSEHNWPAHLFVGSAVFAAWMTLALGGRTRPGRGWIDRLGWSIGLAWVVLFVLSIGLIAQHEWQILHPKPRRPRPAISRVLTSKRPANAARLRIVVQPKEAGVER